MKLPKTFSKNKELVNVIIETPRTSRNKYAYDKDTGLFKLSKVLPAGFSFPFDMGFIPGTKAEDGDPLDALILMDDNTYPGCLVECRVIGVIKAHQKEEDKKEFRNDRIVMIPNEMSESDHIMTMNDLNRHKVKAIIKFFENYNEMEKRKFTLTGVDGPKTALHIIKKNKQ
jgi:inorganic pyrophosphatase